MANDMLLRDAVRAIKLKIQSAAASATPEELLRRWLTRSTQPLPKTTRRNRRLHLNQPIGLGI